MQKQFSLKIETFFQAVSLADQFIKQTLTNSQQLPPLNLLAATALHIIAKIEGAPLRIDDTIRATTSKQDPVFTQDALLELESQIVHKVDFSRLPSSPVPFVERFAQLFGIRDTSDTHVMQVRTLTSQYCRFMYRESCFLALKPSQIAAASLMLAVNISQSFLSQAILGLEPIPLDYFKSCIEEEMKARDWSHSREAGQKSPLHRWTGTIERITQVSREKDLKVSYCILVERLDKYCYGN